MKKKILLTTIIVSAICLFGIMSVSAETIVDSGVCGDNLTWTLSDRGLLTISGEGDMSEWNSPFQNKLNIRNVKVEEGVTSLGNYAFYFCKNLASVELPETLKKINSYAFGWCTSLTSLKIPKNVNFIAGGITAACENLFIEVDENNNDFCDIDGVLYNKAVTEIIAYSKDRLQPTFKIPSTVTTIGEKAFANCYYLTNIRFPNSITAIKKEAFRNCNKLQNVDIPEKVTRLESQVFFDCRSFTSIKIGENINYIGEGALLGCGGLFINVDEQNRYFSSVDGVLFNKNKTEIIAYSKDRLQPSYTIPDGVRSIGNAFYFAYDLEAIRIPDSVRIIESKAFNYCSKLKTAFLPKSLKKIGENAFIASNVLTDIYYDGTADEWEKVKVLKGNDNLLNANIHYGIYVNFVAEDGRIISSIHCIRNTSINALELPDKVGYTAHFYTDYEMTNKFNTNTVISQDTIIYVKYTPKQYKHYFLDEDGSVLKEATVEYGSVIVPPKNPSKPLSIPFKYKFDSWNGYMDGMTQPSSDVYFYAKYSNSIAMDSNGAMITGTKAVTIGEDNINYKVFLETKMDDIVYSTLYIKYPREFMLNKIEAVGFEIVDVESTITEEDYSISKIVAIYSNSGKALPKESLIEAFDLYFNASTNMSPGRATIEITTDSVIMSSKVDYDFDGLYDTSFDILPKLAEGVSIIGDEIVKTKTKYSVVFSPDYTTNKNVEWVVSDPGVAVIEQDGTLTPVSNGSVTLTAHTLDGSNLKATKNITIYAKAKINTITTNVGDWDIPFDSDNRKYTIYVPFDTETIDIITSFDMGTLKINGDLTFNERLKTIALPKVATTITMVRSGVENCIDSVYVLNIVKRRDWWYSWIYKIKRN